MIQRLFHRLIGKSLQRQIAVSVVAVVLLLMSYFVWDMNRYQRQVAIERETGHILSVSRSLAKASGVALAARDLSGLGELVTSAFTSREFAFVMVLDTNGQVLAHSDPNRLGLYVSDLPRTLETALYPHSPNSLSAASPVQLYGQALGWVYIGASDQALRDSLAQINRSSAIHLMFVVAVSVLLSALVSRHLVRRIHTISSVARSVEAGDTLLRARVSGGDETAELAKNFNAMLDTLSQRDMALQESETFKSTVLDSVSAEIAVIDQQGVIVAVNEQWRQFFLDNRGLADQSAVTNAMGVGTNYLHVCAHAADAHDVFTTDAQCGIEAVLKGQLRRFDMDYPCHSPQQCRWFSMTVLPLGLAQGAVIAHTDISRIKLAEQYEVFRSQILELMAGNVELLEVLRAMVLGLEQLHPNMLCSAVLLSDDGKTVAQTVGPSLPDDYNAALVGLAVGVGEGSCGTAAATGERVVVADIATHPYWTKYRALAQSAGLAACWSQPIFSGDGSVLGTFAVYYPQVRSPSDDDIVVMQKTARLAGLAIGHKRTYNALQMREYTFRTLFETAPVGIVYQDSEGKITSANPAAERILGLTLAQMQGRTSTDPRWKAIHEDGSPFPGETHPIMLARKTGQTEHAIMAVDAPGRGRVWISVIGTPLFEGEQVVQAYAVFQDITETYLLQQQVRQMAFYDTLTQLPNRRLLLDRIDRALAACKRSGDLGALMFLDLDNFKPLNDAHGHDAGDLLLTEVAKRLRSCVREQDTVARIGGDEFVVMLTELNGDASLAGPHACSIASKICTSLAEPYELRCHQPDGQTLAVQHHCTASVGVTLFSAMDADHEQILLRADAAMYRAKNQGRNRVVFDEAPRATS